jgi:hypothetical protein
MVFDFSKNLYALYYGKEGVLARMKTYVHGTHII